MRNRTRALSSSFVLTGFVCAGLLATPHAAQADGTRVGASFNSRTRVEGERSDSRSGSRRDDLRVIGLTSTLKLIRFEADSARRASTIGVVSGLAGDSTLIGIDYRPATGDLYAVGNAGGVYTVDPATAIATFRSQLSVIPSGAAFGLDFNPTVDRLRIVSDTGQNLRANVDTGATTVDTPLSAMGIAAAAYTNNDADANTGTTLFDIDALADQVAIQAPPNNGNLNPTGKLTVDAAPAAGFDIYTNVAAGTNSAFASLQVNGESGFYSVNLLTGRATRLGAFRSHLNVVDIAIPLDQGCDRDDNSD